jgi:hypothetical protein
MDEVLKFISDLLEEMNDVSWSIKKIVDYKVIKEDEKEYAKVNDVGDFERQDDIFISQTQSGEDMFYGIIIYPINEQKALMINYAC